MHIQTIHVCTHVQQIMTFKDPESSCESKWSINFSKNIDHLKSTVHPQTTFLCILSRLLQTSFQGKCYGSRGRESGSDWGVALPKSRNQCVGVLGTSRWRSISLRHCSPLCQRTFLIFPLSMSCACCKSPRSFTWSRWPARWPLFVLPVSSKSHCPSFRIFTYTNPKESE